MKYQNPPIYDIAKTYAENAEFGPFFSKLIQKRPPIKEKSSFLGFSVNSRVGVPAGPLLNSIWIYLAGKLGYDIVTYKTIRSAAFPGHPLPNMVYVERKEKGKAVQISEMPEDFSDLTLTNSFGMPSKSPEFLLEDIDRAERSLGEGQVMIVSVVGTPGKKTNLVDDFIDAALLAKAGGAKIIEANFSCPNVDKKDGLLYTNPETVSTFARALKKAIHPLPLILKVGKFAHIDQMRNVFVEASKAGVDAICGLNSVSMKVDPPLGENRPTSGVCGGAIREDALAFVRDAARIRLEEKLDLTLMGCGGIMVPEHFDAFLEAGSDIAMTATAMMWDPDLAWKYHRRKEEVCT